MGFVPPQLTLPNADTVQTVTNTVQGVERGAAAAVGGAVHDVLGMPQAMINIFYNFGGFIIGNVLVMAGVLLLVIAIFGDVVKDGLHEAAEAINPDDKKATVQESIVGRVVETAGTAAGVAAAL